MAERIANLMVRIGADVSEFRAGLNDANRRSKSFATQLGGATRQLVKYGAAAAAAGAAIATHLVRQKLQAIDADAKLAQRMNETMETVATLNRTMELTGVTLSQLEQAQRSLDMAMARATQGGKSQQAAFDKLGVSVEHLQSLPLDRRIETINRALRENVSASERAAVAADIFGARNARALASIDAGVLEQARKEAELFGTALSDIDAAKVEQANDAMSRIGMAIDGVIKQFTVQLAPILQAVGDIFLDVAEDAGGFGNVAEKAFDAAVKGAGFAMDAIHGIRVVIKGVELVFSGLGVVVGQVFTRIIDAWLNVVRIVTSGVETLTNGINRFTRLFGVEIPTTLFDSIKERVEETLQVMDDIRQAQIQGTADLATELHEMMMQQMPSELLQEKVAEYQEISQRMAEEEIERRRHQNLVINEIEEEAADIRKAIYEDEAKTRLQTIQDGLRFVESGMNDMIGSTKKGSMLLGAIKRVESIVNSYAWGSSIGGPPAGAAAAAIAGAAQMRSLKEMGSIGGGSGGAATAGAGASAPSAPTQQFTLALSGFDPQQAMGINQLGDIMDMVNERIRAGNTFGGFSF